MRFDLVLAGDFVVKRRVGLSGETGAGEQAEKDNKRACHSENGIPAFVWH